MAQLAQGGPPVNYDRLQQQQQVQVGEDEWNYRQPTEVPEFEGRGESLPLRPSMDPRQVEQDLVSTSIVKPVRMPPEPNKRLNIWRNLLTDFVWSLSEGAKASVNAPKGRQKMAQFAGALSGPIVRRKFEADLKNQEALANQRNTSAEAALGRMGIDIGRLGLEQGRQSTLIQEALSRIGLNQARTEGTEAQTGLTQANTARARYMTTPNGIFDVNTQQLLPGTGQDRIPITPALAEAFKLPPEMVGSQLRAQDINSLANANKSTKRVFRSAEGVMLLDEGTGEKTKIGDLPPVSQGGGTIRFLYDNYGQIAGAINSRTGQNVNLPGDVIGQRTAGVNQGRLTRTGMFDDMLNKIDVLEELGNKYQWAMGPVAGRTVNWVNRIIADDPEIAALFSYSADLADLEARKRSGATIRPDEEARMLTFMPNPNNQPNAFFVNLQKLREYIQTLRQAETGTGGSVSQDGRNQSREDRPPITPRQPTPAAGPQTARDKIQGAFGGNGGQQ